MFSVYTTGRVRDILLLQFIFFYFNIFIQKQGVSVCLTVCLQSQRVLISPMMIPYFPRIDTPLKWKLSEYLGVQINLRLKEGGWSFGITEAL